MYSSVSGLTWASYSAVYQFGSLSHSQNLHSWAQQVSSLRYSTLIVIESYISVFILVSSISYRYTSTGLATVVLFFLFLLGPL